MEKIEVSAKNVEEALTQAMIKLGTTSDKLGYEVVSEGRSGFLGILSKPAVIRVWVKEEDQELNQFMNTPSKTADAAEEKKEEKTVSEENHAEKHEIPAQKQPVKTAASEKEKPAEKSEQPAADAAPAAKEETAPVSPEKKVLPSDITVASTPEEFITQVCNAMGIQVSVDSKFNEEENVLDINMIGDDMGILIGKRGQTLDSLQYLTGLVANKNKEEYVRVKLDTENYRERRKETLENLARNIAFKVKRSKKPVALEPMNPYERRVIHAALQNDKFVVTRSEGEEPYRHVVISLKREKTYNNSKPSGGKGSYNRENRGNGSNGSYRKGGYNNKRRDYNRDYKKDSQAPEATAAPAADSASDAE